mmetsp:Transcript_54265/g.175443  ORF Transcript_54265/g.175443 Transcript_54265/m.175443 type:complete len:320 (-) Transcript_54265:182-1141(-)
MSCNFSTASRCTSSLTSRTASCLIASSMTRSKTLRNSMYFPSLSACNLVVASCIAADSSSATFARRSCSVCNTGNLDSRTVPAGCNAVLDASHTITAKLAPTAATSVRRSLTSGPFVALRASSDLTSAAIRRKRTDSTRQRAWKSQSLRGASGRVRSSNSIANSSVSRALQGASRCFRSSQHPRTLAPSSCRTRSAASSKAADRRPSARTRLPRPCITTASSLRNFDENNLSAKNTPFCAAFSSSEMSAMTSLLACESTKALAAPFSSFAGAVRSSVPCSCHFACSAASAEPSSTKATMALMDGANESCKSCGKSASTS